MSADKEILDRITQARLELLTQRLQASRQHQQQPPQQQPPQQLLPQHIPTNDSSIATYAAMQEMLRQQRLAISVAQQRRDDLKREIDRLSRQAETEAVTSQLQSLVASISNLAGSQSSKNDTGITAAVVGALNTQAAVMRDLFTNQPQQQIASQVNHVPPWMQPGYQQYSQQQQQPWMQQQQQHQQQHQQQQQQQQQQQFPPWQPPPQNHAPAAYHPDAPSHSGPPPLQLPPPSQDPAVLSALAQSQAGIAQASSSTAAAADLARQTLRSAGPQRGLFSKKDGTAAKADSKRYHVKKYALVALAVARLKKIMERKKVVIKQEQQDEVRDLIETFTDVGRSWLKKIVRTVVTSAATEAGLNLVIEPPSDKRILFVSVGVSEKEVKDRMMKLKVRAKAVVDALLAASKNTQLAPPKPLCSFLARISSDGVYYPGAREVNGVLQSKFLWPEEESVLPMNDDERLIGIQPHQSVLMISNIMFARFLVLSIVLQPWAHNVVPPSAQTKQSTANFKHIASLLLHVYNLALSSLTGIPVEQLRPVTVADGLLPASEEGFQVMLRFCDDEWVQQLKSGIESWLMFMIQNVSPGLLGTSGETVPLQQQQQQQQLPAVGQASAAEILAVPEFVTSRPPSAAFSPPPVTNASPKPQPLVPPSRAQTGSKPVLPSIGEGN